MKTSHSPSTHPVDRHVGHRIQQRRKSLGLTQTQLAEALGISMQQVQKYETAFNRISASRLYELSQALAVPVRFFFEGLPDPGKQDPARPRNGDPLFHPEANEFAQVLEKEGLVLKGALLMDGKWHRVPVIGNKQGSRSGSYRGFLDGKPNGSIMNYKNGQEAVKWISTGTALGPQELERLKVEANARQAAREAE
ncbi:helix-turn-helix domain-containing protein [Rhodospirillum sp. A1_3_36]|uniref:helix-turn-helix domain-containing protein n=1 Tax=Rhodospirillum sp. A1_3_36 TaxID=3391666 RepID=UPI0039A70B80